jgi:arylsulfatase A-like enzyme
VPAFVSGGFLQEEVRGTTYNGLVTGWDWYGTLSELAGIDPTDWRAIAANLPPIDSHSMVPVITGKGRSSRTEMPISTDINLLPMYGKENQVVVRQRTSWPLMSASRPEPTTLLAYM